MHWWSCLNSCIHKISARAEKGAEGHRGVRAHTAARPKLRGLHGAIPCLTCADGVSRTPDVASEYACHEGVPRHSAV